MCLTPATPRRAASAQAPPGGARSLGHRGLAGRRRGGRRPTRAVAPAHRARVVSRDRHAGRRVCDWSGLVGHPRAVPGRGDREGPDHPLQPSPASSSAPARRGVGRLVQHLVCDGRCPVVAGATRRRAGCARSSADPVGRADAAGRHGTARPAVAADGVGRGALAPAAAAVGAPIVARGAGDAGRGAARRGAVRHGQRLQRTRARRPGEDRHRKSARRRHPRHRSGRMASRRAEARHGPGRTRRRRQGRRRPGSSRRRQPPARGEAERAPLGAKRRAPDAPRRHAAPPARGGSPRGRWLHGEALSKTTSARVLAGEAAAEAGLRRSKRSRWRCGRLPLAIVATSTRRLRRVHADALPGAACDLRGRARCCGGHCRPGSARQWRAGVGVLLGVVRRAHRAPVGRLAWRRRSGLPALEVGSGLRG